MTDLLPPPRLDEATRDRMRARLRGATEDDAADRRHGRLAPALAAAAVVAAVAGGATIADRPAPTDAQPTGHGGPGVSTTPTTRVEQHRQQTARQRQHQILRRTEVRFRHLTTRVQSGELSPSYDPPSCTSQLVQADLPDARAYTESATIAHDGGETSLWTVPGRWLVCDRWRSGLGTTTIMHVTDDSAPLERDLFTISMNFGSLHPGISAEYVAGGRVPDGVSAISYRFSDGHVAHALFRNGMWAMVYLPTSGPYDQDRAPLGAQTVVTVTMTDGSTREYTLTMGVDDFCAQVNHGC
jgi:hypothetical protein